MSSGPLIASLATEVAAVELARPGAGAWRDCSSAWRPAVAQSILPEVTARRPPVTLRCSSRARSSRSLRFPDHDFKFSSMDSIRGPAISRHAEAETMIRPTALAKSRTLSSLRFSRSAVCSICSGIFDHKSGSVRVLHVQCKSLSSNLISQKRASVRLRTSLKQKG
jgi:hypothetical protein